ncbi:MAG: hypothetical protein ACKN9D_05605 [Actinomycetales bacterium]
MLRSAVNTCVALAMGAVVLAPAAHAADTTTIVLYAETRGIARIDTNAPGPDHGDVVDREYAMSRTLGGPVIGVTYSESIVVAYNPQAKIDVRRVDTQKVLPGGTLATTGLSELAIGTLPHIASCLRREFDTHILAILSRHCSAGVNGNSRMNIRRAPDRLIKA